MKRRIAIGMACTVMAMLIIACSGMVDSGIELKYPGVEKQMLSVKSGYAYASTFTQTTPSGSRAASSYTVYLANYTLDQSRGMISLGAKLTSDEQLRIDFSLIGVEGSDSKTPLKPGTYPVPEPGELTKMPGLRSTVNISTFTGGKQTDYTLKTGKLTGKVEIKFATESSIEGTIDLTDGEIVIHGSFACKIQGR